MKLTPATELSKGFWFVRRITGENDLGRDTWAIGLLCGDYPFLYGRAIAYADDTTDPNWERALVRKNFEITNPNEWEFGPRIEFPDDN